MHATRGRPSPDGSEGTGRGAERVVNLGTPNRLYQREEQGSAAIHCLSRTAGKPELEARGVEFKARNNGPGLDSRERGVCHSCRQSQTLSCHGVLVSSEQRVTAASPWLIWHSVEGGNVGAHSNPFALLQSHQQAGSQPARQGPQPPITSPRDNSHFALEPQL